MATAIKPVPAAVLASEFPTNADREAGQWNAKAKAWADSENPMVVRTRDIALNAHNNATAASEQAATAATKASEAAASAAAATNNGAAQVTLAKAQVTLASDHATNAATSASAAASERTQAGLDRAATAADRVQTGQDKAATAADRVQTGQDRQATADMVASIADGPVTSVNGKTGVVLLSRADIPGIGSMASRDATVSSLAPSGGANGDVWFRTEGVEVGLYLRDAGVWKGVTMGAALIGAPFGGGFYFGTITIGLAKYMLIIADKSGEMGREWGGSGILAGATSDADSKANTDILVSSATAYPAAEHCRNYRGGGYDDWCLPSKAVLGIAWQNIAPNGAGTPAIFKTGGAQAMSALVYWSSTEVDAANAWQMLGSSGGLSAAGKATNRTARPIRLMRI